MVRNNNALGEPDHDVLTKRRTIAKPLIPSVEVWQRRTLDVHLEPPIDEAGERYVGDSQGVRDKVVTASELFVHET